MTKTTIIKKPRFVIFLTASAEELSFNEVYDFELTKKEVESDGDGFRSWVEFEHNDELLKVPLD